MATQEKRPSDPWALNPPEPDNGRPYSPHRLARDLEKLFGLDCGDDFAELYNEVYKARARTLETCSVCTGDGGMPDGVPCICGGSGKMVDEMAGLRLECLRLRAEVDGLRTDPKRG